MTLAARLRSNIKAARKRGALWVRFADAARLLPSAEGRARLWTRMAHGSEVHQTTPQTAEERYPELFDLAASLAPRAERVLSFGCSTGEELSALRRRFPQAEIVGAEINPRSRAIAARRIAADPHSTVVAPAALDGNFDIIFALSVFQREPHKVEEMEVEDLSAHYPFARFDDGVARLVRILRPSGLLCVINAQYRIEDSSAADLLEPATRSPRMDSTMFGPDGRRLDRPIARTIFRRL
jgi:SAM-dependent methyltransferase